MKRLTGILLLLLALCGPLRSDATPQIPDRLVVGGDTLRMYPFPLSEWLDIPENAAKFDSIKSVLSSACWRGYQATWVLESGKLYLTQVEPCPNQENRPSDLKALFGDRCVDGRVFADWVNGELQASWGNTVSMSMKPVYEYDRFLQIEGGCLVLEKTYRNIAQTPGRMNVWDMNIEEQLIALIAKKIRWGRLGSEKADVRVVHAVLEIAPDGNSSVSGEDVPKQYAAELTRILKGLRWNLLTLRGETQPGNVFLRLSFDLRTRTVAEAQY